MIKSGEWGGIFFIHRETYITSLREREREREKERDRERERERDR